MAGTPPNGAIPFKHEPKIGGESRMLTQVHRGSAIKNTQARNSAAL